MEFENVSSAWQYILDNAHLADYTAIDFIAIVLISVLMGAFVISVACEFAFRLFDRKDRLNSLKSRILLALKCVDCPLEWHEIELLFNLSVFESRKIRKDILPILNYYNYGRCDHCDEELDK